MTTWQPALWNWVLTIVGAMIWGWMLAGLFIDSSIWTILLIGGPLAVLIGAGWSILMDLIDIAINGGGSR